MSKRGKHNSRVRSSLLFLKFCFVIHNIPVRRLTGMSVRKLKCGNSRSPNLVLLWIYYFDFVWIYPNLWRNLFHQKTLFLVSVHTLFFFYLLAFGYYILIFFFFVWNEMFTFTLTHALFLWVSKRFLDPCWKKSA